MLNEVNFLSGLVSDNFAVNLEFGCPRPHFIIMVARGPLGPIHAWLGFRFRLAANYAVGLLLFYSV